MPGVDIVSDVEPAGEGAAVRQIASPRVALLSLGGTIAMTASDSTGPVVPTLRGSDLVDAVPGLADTGITIHPVDFRRVPGASLTFPDLVELISEAGRWAADGVSGIVVTQGTDTIEETAFALDLLWRHDIPLVVTGAMRNPMLAGADGPANLLGAVVTAASPSTRDLGCVVVMSDEIHAARWVRKTHTTSPAAFQSPGAGSIGFLAEGHAHVRHRPPRRCLPSGSAVVAEVRTAVIPMVLGDDGELLRRVDVGFDGLVVAGFGVGHVPATTVEILSRLAADRPVVLTSRIGTGPVLTSTYGFAGSESDLLRRGLIHAGTLDPYKARVLLHLLLASGAAAADIAETFAVLGAEHRYT